MLSIDTADRVIHASSFSKTVSPGVRVGYLAGPAGEIADIAKMANENYISPNMLAESIVLELCDSGVLDRNIDFVKVRLQERRDALVARAREPTFRGRVRRPRRAATSSGSTSPRAPTRSTWPEGEGGRRPVRRRPRLHDRRRREQPAALLRPGAAGVHRRRGLPHLRNDVRPPAMDLAIVIPVLNEREALPGLIAEIMDAVEPLNLDWEVLVVDDGSTDGTFDLIAGMQAEDGRIGGIRLRRNFGKSAALAAGFIHRRRPGGHDRR